MFSLFIHVCVYVLTFVFLYSLSQGLVVARIRCWDSIFSLLSCDRNKSSKHQTKTHVWDSLFLNDRSTKSDSAAEKIASAVPCHALVRGPERGAWKLEVSEWISVMFTCIFAHMMHTIFVTYMHMSKHSRVQYNHHFCNLNLWSLPQTREPWNSNEMMYARFRRTDLMKLPLYARSPANVLCVFFLSEFAIPLRPSIAPASARRHLA